VKINNWKIFLGMNLAVGLFLLGHGGAAFGQQGCGTVNGVVDLKEGGQPGQRTQYWINGFPGKDAACPYTLELCFIGDRPEIGAKTFITMADGAKQQSADNIVNCNNGWSHFFDGQVAGAREIFVGVDGGYSLRARFVGKSQLRQR